MDIFKRMKKRMERTCPPEGKKKINLLTENRTWIYSSVYVYKTRQNTREWRPYSSRKPLFEEDAARYIIFYQQ